VVGKLLVDQPANRKTDKSSPEGSLFSMESFMRNRLQVSFWGLHLTADGMVAIGAAVLIVIAVLVAACTH
jgi:hypothetical protein